MSVRHFILATAGHVDHGKSALIKALTGVDPDRLPEEKARGITIDLGFAHLELPAPANGAPVTKFSVGIIDVPGHEDFVKNMVAGVGSVDVALLVVAADDGWMPQTEEHLQILSYLGVKRGVVALTKVDLAEGIEADQEEDIRRRLQNSPLAGAPIVRTSVVAGRGLEDVKSELIRMLAETAPPRHLGKPRLPVDRAFTLQGIGTVVTGTLAGGTLLRGQQVVLQPSGRATRVRALQNHLHDLEQCGPGMRTALNLPDVVAGQTARRGDVVTLPDLGSPSDTVHVVLEKSSRLAETTSPGARPLKDGVLARVHHGSGNWPARIVLAGRGPLRPGEILLAELRFETPVFVMAGDRFIVRDWSEQATLGGGVVLDPHGDRRKFREESRRAALEERAAAPTDAGVAVASELRMRSMGRVANFLPQACFGAEEIQEALRLMEENGTAVRMGEWIADGSWWNTVRERAAQCIRREHQDHPERPGLALNELRAHLERHLPNAELFPVLIADLGRHGFLQEGTNIREQSHRPALPENLQTAGQKLRTALQQNPFEPPTKKDLLAIPQAAPALQFLIQAGEAVPISDDTIMAADALRNATDRICRYLKNKGGASASELRQILKTSRRVIIPLLERLDKEGVTMRQGDQRVLKPPG